MKKIAYFTHRADVIRPDRRQVIRFLGEIDESIEVSTFEGGFEHHIFQGRPVPCQLVSNFSTVSIVCSYLPLSIKNWVLNMSPRDLAPERRLHYQNLSYQFHVLRNKGLNVSVLSKEDLATRRFSTAPVS